MSDMHLVSIVVSSIQWCESLRAWVGSLLDYTYIDFSSSAFPQARRELGSESGGASGGCGSRLVPGRLLAACPHSHLKRKAIAV